MGKSKKKRLVKAISVENKTNVLPFWLSLLFLIGVGIFTYANSFQGVFLFDDIVILNHPPLHHLWPILDVIGHTNRPLLNLSLALNYAIGQTNPWGYHAFNLVIHLLAAIVLWAIVRRTLQTKRLNPVYGPRAGALALAIAVIWMVHPIQTGSVTYIIQRAESMMGLFFLLTLYSSLRSMERNSSWMWNVFAVLACAAGVATKEVAVTAPITVILYDRIFFVTSWREILYKRWLLYIGFLGCWGLSTFFLNQTDLYKHSAGFHIPGISWGDYLLTQPGVIVHYLRLTFFPIGLCLNYLWQPASSLSTILPPLAMILLLMAGTIWALKFHPPLGFWGGWFFIILSVTSSFIPLADLAFEHRMYLPLAAVITVAVLGCDYGMRRFVKVEINRRLIGISLIGSITVIFSILTILRNRDYYSEIGMLEDVVRKRPENVRALSDLGLALVKQRRFEEGVSYLSQAVKMFPDNPANFNALGLAEYYQGHSSEASKYFQKAIQLGPDYDEAQMNLGLTFAALGEVEKAKEQYLKALSLDPNFAEANNNLGSLYLDLGKYQQAMDYCLKAINLKPHYETPYNNVGVAALLSGNLPLAEQYLKKAIALKPDYAKAINNLGVVYKMEKKFNEAEVLFKEALRIDPAYIQAKRNLDEVVQFRQLR